MIQKHPVFAICNQTVTSTADSGVGSLRQAVIDANLFSNTDSVCFNIPGSGIHTIALSSPLNPIIYPVVIDGTTQLNFAGTPVIELNGQNATSVSIPERGFYLTNQAQGSTIRGLIINRFRSHGIFIDTKNITIVGNYIGLGADGTTDAGNGDDGIGIYSATSATSSIADTNIIGGTTANDRNVISGNAGNGIGITAYNGGKARNNTISGNYIGTNAAGTGIVSNDGDGILLNTIDGSGTATGTIIGGTTLTTPDGACSGACNLISGNKANGMGTWFSGVTNTQIKGNYIGTNVNGTSALANGNIGIELNESPNNQVGGTTPQERNILSGNLGAGLFITGISSTGNVASGNYIGTNASGTAGIANIKMGISIGPSNGPPPAVGASANIIGGSTSTTPGRGCAGACNLISGNQGNGILISSAESSGNSILGNYIGLNAAGTIAVGNVSDGIGILNTPNTLIGDSTTNGQNVIAGNGNNGIIIVGGASTGNRINNNIIGFLGFGNTHSGVAISSATDTAILSNSMFYNGGLDIDLDNNGTTNKNDPGDSDIGANRLQNYPNVFSVKTVGGNTKIGGNFNSNPSTNYVLQFFASNGCNASAPNNFGESEVFLGSTDVSTDIYGNTAFSFTPVSPVAGGKYITATATKKIGSIAAETSETSQCILVNVMKPAVTNGANWYLKYDLTSGPSEIAFGYGFPANLLMCAWDVNQPGVKLPVVVVNSTWLMRASYTPGTADLSFQYGFNGAKPLCGDWDGDGIDTPGLAVDGNSQKTWFLRNSNTTGVADSTFTYGPLGSKPVVGDWDGNGTDTVGLVDNLNGGGSRWYLRNTNSSGGVDVSPPFFDIGAQGEPVVGDWDGNGTDTVGLFTPGSIWRLKNSNNAGSLNIVFSYGISGATPILW